MTVQFYFKPTKLEQQMDAHFISFKQEIIDHLTAKVEAQKAIEISEILVEISQETHTSSNFRAEVRLVPLKSSVFDEIRVVEEHKDYLPAIRHAANKAIEILMEEKNRIID